MSKKNSKTTVEVSGILNSVGAQLLDAVAVPVSEIVTWGTLNPSADGDVTNVGRDVSHTEEQICARAVDLLENGQFLPIFTTPVDGYDHVVIDGEGRYLAARKICDGFDFDGTSYPPQPDYTLLVRSIAKPDGSYLSHHEIVALGRFFNTNRNQNGVGGFMSMALTFQALKKVNPDLKGKAAVNLMRANGYDIGEDSLSRAKALLSLPQGMQKQILIGENSNSAGIGHTVLAPFLTREKLADGKLGKLRVQPTDAQWEAFYAKCEWVQVIDEGKKKEQRITRHDLRGEVIAAWYECEFDLEGTEDEPSPFAKWTPGPDENGAMRNPKRKRVVAVKTQAEIDREEARREFAWKTFKGLLQVNVQKKSCPPAVKEAAERIFDLLDRMNYSETENNRVPAHMAAAEMIKSLVRLQQKVGASEAA